MFVANTELRFGGQVVEPGQPIPQDHGMPHHILKVHLDQRLILDTDQARAAEIRERHLKVKRDAAEVEAKRVTAKLQRAIAEAREESEAALVAAQAVESSYAQAVETTKKEAAAAAARLEALDAELARSVTPKKKGN